MVKATSPASSGPAGSLFEGQIGAYYMLSMLTGAEPRGLPNTTIERVELQRAAEGHPLDDVIVHAFNQRGEPAVLEIQVKRSITFTPTDPVFQAVMSQIVEASKKPDFRNKRYELAIAIARTSRQIDGAYQDVLTWARELGDAKTFMERIERHGSANPRMRTFLKTFKVHLENAGANYNDEKVWQLLRKLQILVFDFTSQGSSSEELVKERAIHALHPEQISRAGDLWSNLTELSIRAAASGGDRTRDQLIEDLTAQSYRLAGNRQYRSARTALAEASQNALNDIDDKVGGIMLTRHERVAAVHAALDEGRYVEIRGDAGVGKSGVLKHFARQIASEAQVIVLSPGRTTSKGWMAMRAQIGFDGNARELLWDLAADGAAVLFLDGLDMFDDEERRTVVDLVREAANVPGFSVIVTARRNFGVEEQNWLPADALDQLGPATPVMISELDEAEIDELRYLAPKLAALLTDSHPAREVTRNLFRLARLVSQSMDEPVPRTEIDMAKQWWQTADGRYDDDHRERARLLKALAVQALSSSAPLDVSDHPASAVNALVMSETLRDLKGDHVAFRHDVLREWAIANLLSSEPGKISRFHLNRPAPGSLARGVELTARMVIEYAPDSSHWQSLLEMLSSEGMHGSWRRSVLLSLVRSEIGVDLLASVSDLLLTDRSRLLRELIRTVMAVDVEPASKLFTAVGVDPSVIPSSLNVPSGQSWYRLILWLLALGEDLPAAAIPDVVDLYTSWSGGMIGLDPLTPKLLTWLHHWLTEIETTRETKTYRDRRAPFDGELDYDQISHLKQDLLTGFLLFCNRTPKLAVEYLQSVLQRKHNDNVVRSIINFRGALAQAAPKELVELTASALIPKHQPDKQRHRHREFKEPFNFIDHVFIPVSPAQGPFLELLTHAPEHGLSLIRQLVDHAILFNSGGRKFDSDAINITFPDGESVFPWIHSYTWSRQNGPYSCITSALMALEAWAHTRIEKGDTFDNVLADILGTPGSPAAYLLVAVDLLLSHWPRSREVAVPFLASPELLCLDRQRQALDNVKFPDFFGLSELQKEPSGLASLASLKKRHSRNLSLDQIIGQYAVYGPEELRKTLEELLHQAVERLGVPDEQSDFGDPSFMVAHALNLADPINWQEKSVELDGTQTVIREYIPPKIESEHLKFMHETSREQFADNNMQNALQLALEDPSHSSIELAAAAVLWAKGAVTKEMDDGSDNDWMREQAVLTSAMIVMRDGDAKLRAKHETWVRSIFIRALQTEKDSAHRFRSGIRFNPVAIAFVGFVHLLQDNNTPEDVRALLTIAARDDPAAAHGFGASASVLSAIDEHLPLSMLRCAFTACIQPNREWDLPEKELAGRIERYQQRVQAALDAEVAWLADECAEPNWPTFPSEQVHARSRRGIRIGKSHIEESALPSTEPEEYTDHQAAALWLSNTASLVDVIKRPWLRDIIYNYGTWTATANGAGLDQGEDITNKPMEWNNAYFNLLAHCLPGMEPQEVDQLALTPISSLPDESFFDVVTQFLHSVDEVYFNDQVLQEVEAVRIRSVLGKRLMLSNGWRRLAGIRSSSIEMHIGPAIAVFFFNNHIFSQPPECYLLEKGIDQLDAFIPVLEKLVEKGSCLFVALATLNLLEVSTRRGHLQFIVTSAKAWLANYSDDSSFWVDHGIGRRVCTLIDGLLLQEQELLTPEHPVRLDIDAMLATMIQLGVAEAGRLETSLIDG